MCATFVGVSNPNKIYKRFSQMLSFGSISKFPKIFPFSMGEIRTVFKKLLQDNKNGAVMTMSKEKSAPAKFFYVEQKWNEVK